MLGIFVVEFSATTILHSSQAQDIKIGVAEANILIWSWCLQWNHHTWKHNLVQVRIQSSSALYLQLHISCALLVFHLNLSTFMLSKTLSTIMRVNEGMKLKGSCVFDVWWYLWRHELTYKYLAQGISLLEFWTFHLLKVGVAEKTDLHNSRIVEGRETKRSGQLVVGSVLQDSGEQQHLSIFQILLFNVANKIFHSRIY